MSYDMLSMVLELADSDPVLRTIWDEAEADDVLLPYPVFTRMAVELYSQARLDTPDTRQILSKALAVLERAWMEDADDGEGIRNLVRLQFVDMMCTDKDQATSLILSLVPPGLREAFPEDCLNG